MSVSQTLYAQSLNQKVKKHELKRALHLLFSAHGVLLDLVVSKKPKLRGQAWIVFDSAVSSTNALRALQGLPFYDRPLKLSYAEGKSDAAARAEGTFVPKNKRDIAKKMAEDRAARRAAGEARPAPGVGVPGPASEAAAPTGTPNKILFVQGLPEQTTAPSLTVLFQQFPGFAEVRMVPAKPGIAFVEYQSEAQAGVALMGLNGFKLTATHTLALSYAKQ